MIGLTRQFRDKTDEYFTFDVITTSSPETVTFGLGRNSEYMSSFAQHIVEWGDGNKSYMNTSNISHSYSTAGTYTIRVWTRLKSYNFTEFNLLTSQDLPSLDLSFSKTIHKVYFDSNNDVTYFKLPENTLSTKELVLSLGFNNFNTDSDILDLSGYNYFGTIFRLAGSSNVRRILLPASNSNSNFTFTWNDDVVEAIGPNADVTGNYEVDLDGMNIYDTCRITASTDNPDNFNSINLPATAFAPPGIRQLFIAGSNCTNIDVSSVIWNQSDTSMQLYIINNNSLQNITFATSSVSASGMFKDIVLFSNDLQDSTLDFSAYELSAKSSLYINSSTGYNNSTDTIVFKPSVNTTLIQLYAKAGIFANFNFTDIPNATNINNSYLEMSSNSMTSAQVNKILYDLDAISTSGYTGRQIFLGGNSAPDSSSGGYDGLTAKTNLITKGFTVYTA